MVTGDEAMEAETVFSDDPIPDDTVWVVPEPGVPFL
jgi:hypothetical protein